jgi:hypothetical protein
VYELAPGEGRCQIDPFQCVIIVLVSLVFFVGPFGCSCTITDPKSVVEKSEDVSEPPSVVSS